jgi:general secretion pathway protein G
MINRLKHRMQEDEGFTLIELLIVIVVLGILAAIVVFALSNQTSNSASAACKSDAKAVEIAQEAYRANNTSPGFAADIATLLVPDPQGNVYLRTAPSINHYVIVTHTDGKVYVFPKGTAITAAANAANDFDAVPTICNATTATPAGVVS